MRRLFILYDADCGFCTWARNWLARQPAYLELTFIPTGSAWANRLFPQLASPSGTEELVVISDEGGVYRSGNAWIMCLFALKEYREWSLRLSRPHLVPLARRAFAILSKNRKDLSKWLSLESESEMVNTLKQVFIPACEPRSTSAELQTADTPS